MGDRSSKNSRSRTILEGVLNNKSDGICNAYPLLRHNTADNQNNKETPQKTPTEGKESNNKGKRKRKEEEMKEDDLLWQRLKGGQDVSRSERQQQRLQHWKETVTKTYEGCQAINERSIECSCGKIFPINKLNAINDIGRAHVSKCKRQKESQSSETYCAKQFWDKYLEKK